jgi:N-acyl-D-amino-acid deacylase
VFDIILSNGTVIDGTGAPGVRQDVGVVRDEITEVGDLSDAETASRIDVAEHVVAPGFIDLHTHNDSEMDGGIQNIPDADNYLRQGVTTCVGGNCGGSGFPIGENLDRISQLEIRNNLALLVGCNTSRRKVLQEKRPATDDEIQEMKRWVREGFEDGAIGLSSGVQYLPFLTTQELIEMSRVAADFGSFYVSHIRNEGDDLLDSVREVIEVARQSGAPGQVSHIKCYGQDNWGKSTQALELIHDAVEREGLDVSADQYPYTGCFTGLAGVLFGQEVLYQAHKEGGLEALLTGTLRKAAQSSFEKVIERLDGGNGIILAPLNPHPEFQGKTLAAYLDGEGGDPLEQTVNLCESDRISAIYLAMCEEDVRTYMKDPLVMVGSDGHLRVFGKSFSHPRNFGTFPRVLARYVREDKVITVEEAIRKMTTMPAKRLGFKKRGRLAKGMVADITVFNPDTVEDTATFQEGNSYATGFRLVLMGGKVALENDKPAEKGYGRVIRRGEES